MTIALIAPIAAAIITALVALTIAFLNYQSTKRLERVRSSYSLVNRDLEKLEQLNLRFREYSIPSWDRVDAAVRLEGEPLKVAFQELYNELAAPYEQARLEMIVNKHIFDRDLVDSAEQLADQVTGATSGGEEIGLSYPGSDWLLKEHPRAD